MYEYLEVNAQSTYDLFVQYSYSTRTVAHSGGDSVRLRYWDDIHRELQSESHDNIELNSIAQFFFESCLGSG